eukprot:gene9874-biopygen6231
MNGNINSKTRGTVPCAAGAPFRACTFGPRGSYWLDTVRLGEYLSGRTAEHDYEKGAHTWERRPLAPGGGHEEGKPNPRIPSFLLLLHPDEHAGRAGISVAHSASSAATSRARTVFDVEEGQRSVCMGETLSLARRKGCATRGHIPVGSGQPASQEWSNVCDP